MDWFDLKYSPRKCETQWDSLEPVLLKQKSATECGSECLSDPLSSLLRRALHLSVKNHKAAQDVVLGTIDFAKPAGRVDKT